MNQSLRAAGGALVAALMLVGSVAACAWVLCSTDLLRFATRSIPLGALLALLVASAVLYWRGRG